jgi:hypothetical protein
VKDETRKQKLGQRKKKKEEANLGKHPKPGQI